MAPLQKRHRFWRSLFSKLERERLDESRYLALSIALIYAAISVMWIAYSDRLLATWASSLEILTELQTFKGWFFVGCTSLLLYSLIQRGMRQLQQKHQLLLNIINSTNDAVFVKDIQGRYLIINKTSAGFLGVRPIDLIGKADVQFFNAEEARQIRSTEETIVRTGRSVEVEELLTIHGEPRWFSTTKNLCLDERSRPIGIVGVARDITQRKQAEAALRDNEERLRLALMATQQGLYDLNVQTGEVVINPEYAMMLGFDPADFHETATRWADRLHPDDRENTIRTYQAYVNGEISNYRTEFRQRTKSGDWKWILSLGKVVAWDDAGRALRMLGTHTDISDRKRLEAERKQAEEELQRSAQLRAELKILENIFEIIQAGYWDWDILNDREYLSPMFKQMLGYEDHELVNATETWQRLIFPEDLPKVIESFNQHANSHGQIPYYDEVRYHHKDGSTIWVICSGRVIEWDANGKPLRAIGCHLNITDRKQAEEALRASQRRYAALTEAAPVAISQFDTAGHCVYVNERWSEMTGKPVETALGMGWLQTLPPEDRDAYGTKWLQSLQQEGTFRAESRCLRPDGSIAWFYCQVLPETDAQGTVIGYIGTLTDITDRKQVEEQLCLSNECISLANAKLARATRLKDEFLANMSHELRTPLNSILGMSEMLAEEIYGELNEAQHQYVEVITQSGNHLLNLINDILDLAKIESGKVTLEVAPTSIPALCSSSLNFVKQVAHQKNIRLETHIFPDLNSIEVDERRIRQALINLLSNAVKFTPERGRIRLGVDYDRLRQMVQFSVTDTGIGIAAEDIPKLFQSFVQIDSELNRQYSGTGLGLALVKQIVELHQGIVEVTSTIGQGSCFRMMLPISSSAQTPVQVIQSDQDQQSEQSSASPAQSPAQPLILLAEDNQANIDTFSSYLTSYGFRLITATDGQAAVNLAKEYQPDLILMDIQMPGVDGLEATRRIRADQTLADVPIIALTALAMAGDREKCLAAGATEYLAKPVSLKQLVQAIQQILSI